MFERFKSKGRTELEGASKGAVRRELTAQEIKEIDKSLKVAKESLLSMFSYVNFVYGLSRPGLFGGFSIGHMGKRTEEQMVFTRKTYEELSKVMRIAEVSEEKILPGGTAKGFAKFARIYEELTRSEEHSELREKASKEFRDFLLGIPVLGRSGLARLYLQVIDAERRIGKSYSEALKEA